MTESKQKVLSKSEFQQIQMYSNGYLQQIMKNCNAEWKSVIVDMYVRVLADSYANDEEGLKAHIKDVKKSVKDLIDLVNTIRANQQIQKSNKAE